MQSTELEELAALDAAGALTEDEQRSLRDRLACATPDERAAVAELYELAAALAVEDSTRRATPAPSPNVRARLVARLSRPFGGAQGRPFGGAQGRPFGGAQGRPFGGAQGRPFGGAQGRPFGDAPGKPGIYSLRASEGTWLTSPVPGIRVKVLSVDPARDSVVILMKVEPGTRYPAHHHSGAEECYVISGEVTIHGQRLQAGDFHHAEAGSDHEVLYSEPGAELLLVVSARDYL